MKKLLRKIHRNLYFLLFILLFAYAQSIQIRILAIRTINGYIFTPEAAIMTFFTSCLLFGIINFFIHNWQKSAILRIHEVVKIFSASLASYIVLVKLLGYIIALAFGTVERNFNSKTLTLSTFSDFMDGFIYGSFFLAYYYYSKNKNHQQQLATYHQAVSEIRINQLRAQLNPHFLFNNLNILDQLIEEDKHKASDFLNEFADIYRYVLQASDKKLVPLNEELLFADQYFRLIQHKYGNAYQLTVESTNRNGYISPLTLQLLIENAVQHNLGTEANPICIKINTEPNLLVSNNLIPKRNTKSISGRALNNLKEQYKLLANKPIEILKTNTVFSVTIPLIHTIEK